MKDLRVLFLAAVLLAGPAGAASSHIVTGAAPPHTPASGPGPDGLWGTPDDAPDLTTNIDMSSTFFSDPGNSGFSVGSFDTNGGGPNVFGVNAMTSLATTGYYSNAFFGVFDEAFSQTLDIAVPATITILPDHTTSGSFGLDAFTPTFGAAKLFVSGAGFWLTPADDPIAIFGAGTPELANFMTLEPILPVGWTVFTYVVQDYVYTSGAAAGLAGVQHANFVSLDPGAVPIPVPAAAWLLISGLGLLRFKRRRIH